MQSLIRIRELGGLHDAHVRALTIGFTDRVLRFELDNFYANFAGYTGDPGAVSGSIRFIGVSQLVVNLEPFTNPDEIPWIYDLDAIANEEGLDFTIRFSPAGCITGKAMELEITEPFPDRFREGNP